MTLRLQCRSAARLWVALWTVGLVVWSAAATTARSAEPEKHNVLEHFPTAKISMKTKGRQQATGIEISYNTSKLTHSGDWIEVSWSGVAAPSLTDLLAVYSPPDAYTAGTAPIKFANASDAVGYLESGEGRLALRLINLRADLRIVLVRGSEEPFVAAVGPVIRNINPNEPTGIHLMRTKKATEMMVQFTTRDSKQPVVRYGRKPKSLDFQVPATTASYGRKDMCGAPATTLGFVDPGLLHTAIMSGLQPDTDYFYTVGDEALDTFSPVYSFRTAPEVGPDATVHILTLADQGVGEVDGSYAVMEYLPAAEVAALTVAEGLAGPPSGGRYSLVLHNGDIAYARGYGALWDAFLFQQQELAARVPYMVCIGNHERDHPGQQIHPTTDSGGECGVPYEARFPMPTSGPDRPWYSFEHGPIHFTVMSTEHHYEPGSLQYAWLDADLASVDRASTPWLVLIGHRPIYIDANDFWDEGKQTTAIQLQMALEGLLDKYGVDVALSGHHHSYQRTCPVYQKACQGGDSSNRRRRGTVHICVGNAGAQFYNNGFEETPTWIEHEAQLTHGYARLAVNATHFSIEAVDSSTSKVFDRAMLVKEGSSRTRWAGGNLLTRFGQRLASSAMTA